jgi:hypothetical protein
MTRSRPALEPQTQKNQVCTCAAAKAAKVAQVSAAKCRLTRPAPGSHATRATTAVIADCVGRLTGFSRAASNYKRDRNGLRDSGTINNRLRYRHKERQSRKREANMKFAVTAAVGLLGAALIAAPMTPASAHGGFCGPFLPLCVVGAVVTGAAVVATAPFAVAGAALGAPGYYPPPPPPPAYYPPAYYPAPQAYYPAPGYYYPSRPYYGP